MTKKADKGSTVTITTPKDKIQVDKQEEVRRMFALAVLNMTWQLAIVVLVPIVGGYKLDQSLGTLPLLTILGFIIAMGSVVIVVRKQLQVMGPGKPSEGKRTK